MAAKTNTAGHNIKQQSVRSDRTPAQINMTSDRHDLMSVILINIKQNSPLFSLNYEILLITYLNSLFLKRKEQSRFIFTVYFINTNNYKCNIQNHIQKYESMQEIKCQLHIIIYRIWNVYHKLIVLNLILNYISITIEMSITTYCSSISSISSSRRCWIWHAGCAGMWTVLSLIILLLRLVNYRGWVKVKYRCL